MFFIVSLSFAEQRIGARLDKDGKTDLSKDAKTSRLSNSALRVAHLPQLHEIIYWNRTLFPFVLLQLNPPLSNRRAVKFFTSPPSPTTRNPLKGGSPVAGGTTSSTYGGIVNRCAEVRSLQKNIVTATLLSVPLNLIPDIETRPFGSPPVYLTSCPDTLTTVLIASLFVQDSDGVRFAVIRNGPIELSPFPPEPSIV